KEELKQIDKEVTLIPLTYDFSFKRVFNNNLELLKDFLISVLNLEYILDPKECKIELLPNELPKENKNEYKKTLDINVVLNEEVHVDIEVNRESFNDIKLRNLMFADKGYSMLLETGDNYHLLNDKILYQLNLNAREKQILIGDDIVVPYGLKSKMVYNENKKIVIKYLAYYRHLYYNKGTKKKSDIWLAALTAETFSELEEMLSHILTPKDKDRFIREVIEMSKEEFSLHEWEKEKLDALVESEKRKNAVNEGIEQGSKQKELDIAKNMLLKKFDVQTIVEVTNLSKEEIETLK
ncbi:MAG: Rpn family recombination-promoting nuclease/putative transposase, partial [Bacilli bacterium]|nr:Rpn family recombination-promoting nuclease/putative transposase [Bacilli bacterium]